MLSSGELGRLLGVTAQTIRNRVKRGEITPTAWTDRGHLRFDGVPVEIVGQTQPGTLPPALGVTHGWQKFNFKGEVKTVKSCIGSADIHFPDDRLPDFTVDRIGPSQWQLKSMTKRPFSVHYILLPFGGPGSVSLSCLPPNDPVG